MKYSHILFILCITSSSHCFGQFVHFHTHLNNQDTKTRAILATLLATIAKRKSELNKNTATLATALASYKSQHELQYRKNDYDKNNSFLSNAPSFALSLGTYTLSQKKNLPYMTKEKEEFIRATTMDKALLLALQGQTLGGAKTKIKSSKRQEIYRLRNLLLREFSKNDRNARQLLNLPVAGLITQNFEDFVELYNLLNVVEIAM